MRIPAFTAAGAALLALALPARAQEVTVAPVAYVDADTTPRTSLQKGTWSLSFSVPALSSSGGSGEFGAWEMIGPRTNLGLTLGVGVHGQDAEADGVEATQASTSIDLGLNVKQYMRGPQEVTPFLLGGVTAGARFERREGAQFEDTTRGTSLSVRGAVGVEWFPVRRISVSGQTGIGIQSTRLRLNSELPDDTTRETRANSLSFNTFTSALTLQIWF